MSRVCEVCLERVSSFPAENAQMAAESLPNQYSPITGCSFRYMFVYGSSSFFVLQVAFLGNDGSDCKVSQVIPNTIMNAMLKRSLYGYMKLISLHNHLEIH